MLRYVVLIWNERCSSTNIAATSLLANCTLDAAHGWDEVLRAPGITVRCHRSSTSRAKDVIPLHGKRGVVFGKVFSQGGTDGASRQYPHFDERVSNEIVASNGKVLIDQFWGAYVAFLTDERRGRVLVLRDPTGGVPCQHAQVDGIHVYFVRLEDLESIRPRSWSLNRRYIVGRLVYKSICTTDTGLNEVETLLAGECAEHVLGTRRRSFCWSPLKIAGNDIFKKDNEAVEALRAATRTATETWMRCFKSIYLALSGGLDSSILLGCLRRVRDSSSTVTCFNFYRPSTNNDERHFARLAAARADVPLLEAEMSAHFNLEGLRHLRKSVCPFASYRDFDGTLARIVEDPSNSAVFTGQGGDELFGSMTRLPPAIDYAWSHGFQRGLLRVALSDAILRDVSVWRILRLAVRYAVARPRWTFREYLAVSNSPLLTDQVLEQARHDDQLIHPLYREPPDVAPGKIEQAYLLTFQCVAFHDPGIPEQYPALVAPLRSQPLMEVCLRIPMYLLISDGRDRAIARRAFVDELPREILLRKSKGTGESNMRATFVYNRALIREFLLGGILASEGYLNCKELDVVLSDQPTLAQSHVMEIFDLLDTEAWARTVTTHDRPAGTSIRNVKPAIWCATAAS